MSTFTEIHNHLGEWKQTANYFQYFGVTLILFGIVSGLAISTFTTELGTQKTKILGFVSAVCSALLASYSPFDKSAAATLSKSILLAPIEN